MRIVCVAGSNQKEATSTKLIRYVSKYMTDKGHKATGLS